MKCIRCGRPLAAIPAATVQTKQGVSAWGPVCARKAGLMEKPTKPMPLFARLPAKSQEPADENQMLLELTV